MSFISYAQNNEDVLLWRALCHVAPGEGFYIDVGAGDPVEHSVTKAFYDAGWRGINIEPLPAHAADFEAQRPRDLNLALAAGSADGSLTLYDVPAVRGWASPDPAVAARHRAEGHLVAELTVPARTLASICREYLRADAPVHFLKIDVEGHEAEVLRGTDFTRCRPWVLVIEATLPNSRRASHAGWEHLVTAQDYRYAWFDGLNRYYVAAEQAGLLRHFGVQPNVFDDFMSWHLVQAWDATQRSEQALRASDGRLADAQRGLAALADEKKLAQADAADARDTAARARAASAEADAATAAAQARADAAQAETAQARAEAAQAAAGAAQARTEAAAALAGATAAHSAAAAAQAGTGAARLDAARARLEATLARAAMVRAQAGIAEAQADIARLHGEYERAAASGRQAAEWARDLEQRLLAMLASTSWKLTRPLRQAGTLVRRMRRPGLARRALERIVAHEPLRRRLVPVLLRHPALGRRVSTLLRTARQAPHAPAATEAAEAASQVPEALRHMPLSTRAVLADLHLARSRQAHRHQPDDRCAS